MDKDTIEVCWDILMNYIKASDRQNAADHLINEIIDIGIDDFDLAKLTNDKYLKTAIDEYASSDQNDTENWDSDQ